MKTGFSPILNLATLNMLPRRFLSVTAVCTIMAVVVLTRCGYDTGGNSPGAGKPSKKSDNHFNPVI
jgi:hypothetical protein